MSADLIALPLSLRVPLLAWIEEAGAEAVARRCYVSPDLLGALLRGEGAPPTIGRRVLEAVLRWEAGAMASMEEPDA